MILLGDKFSTLLGTVDGKFCVVKTQDRTVSDRQSSQCYREYLGYRLGSRLGLLIPRTFLCVHEQLGRISAQQFLWQSRPVAKAALGRLRTSTTGFRILLLDLLCRNFDRCPRNMLCAGKAVFPIDFNVAFGFQDRYDLDAECNAIVLSWLGIDGAVSLVPSDWDRLLGEAYRMQHLLDDRFVQAVLVEIDDEFLDPSQKRRHVQHLIDRTEQMPQCLIDWWEKTVHPVHQLLSQAGD